MTEIDAAYAGRLTAETAAYEQRSCSEYVIIQPAKRASAHVTRHGVEHHCYLCGGTWETPFLSWIEHNRSCTALRPASLRR